MNKNRLRKHEQSLNTKLRLKKAKDWVRSWIYKDSSFNRLNPNE